MQIVHEVAGSLTCKVRSPSSVCIMGPKRDGVGGTPPCRQGRQSKLQASCLGLGSGVGADVWNS